MPADPQPIQDLVRAGVARLRLKLLDLTNRNRLLNFRFAEGSRRFVRVIDEIPEVLFERLTDDGSRRVRLYLEALPATAPDTAPVEEHAGIAALSTADAATGMPGSSASTQLLHPAVPRAAPAEWARQHGIDPSFDLPRASQESRAAQPGDDRIQTLLYPDVLQVKLAAIRADAVLARQELGLGTLHAAFAFLEWYESSDSQQALYSPLVLVPLTMDRDLDEGRYRYYIEAGGGTEPASNVALRERLRRDFGLELPALEAQDTLDPYLSRVARVIRDQPRWKIRRFVVIGHFSCARLSMYEDLDPARWEGAALESHPLIATLLAGAADASADRHAPHYDVDDAQPEDLAPLLVTDADSSQYSAIVDAMQGRSYALRGPPGTGKSQTITNLIAATLGAGRSVLFVAAKQAALNVVAQRLTQAGLGDFVLELHSTNMGKQAVLEALEHRLALRPAPPDRRLARTRAELRKTRAALHSYASVLNAPVGASGVTLHEAYWMDLSARRALEPEEARLAAGVAETPAGDLGLHDAASAQALLGELADSHRHCAAAADAQLGHPLRGVRQLSLNSDDQAAFRRSLAAWDEALERVERGAARGPTLFGCELPASCAELARLGETLAALPDPPPGADAGLLARIGAGKECGDLIELTRQVASGLAERDALAGTFRDVDEVLPAAATRWREASEGLAGAMDALGIGNPSLPVLQGLLEDTEAEFERTATALTILGQFVAVVAPGRAMDCAQVGHWVDAIAVIRATPQAVLRARSPALYDADARTELERLAAAARQLLTQSEALSARLGLTYEEDPVALAAAGRTLVQTHPLMRWWSPAYRAAKTQWRVLAGVRWSGTAAAAADLAAAAELIDRRRRYSADRTLGRLAAGENAGLATPFDTLIGVVGYWHEVRRRWPTLDPERAHVQRALLESDRALLREVADALGGAGVDRLRDLATYCRDTPAIAATDRLTERRILLRDSRRALAELRSVSYAHPLRVRDAPAAFRALEQLTGRWQALRARPFGDALPAHSAPQAADLARLRSTAEYAQALEDAALPQGVRMRILSRRSGAMVDVARKFGALLAQSTSKSQAAEAAFASLADLDAAQWHDPGAAPGIAAQRSRIARAAAVSDEVLTDWAVHRNRLGQCARLGLGAISELVDRGAIRPACGPAVFRVVHARSLIRAAGARCPELATWTGSHIAALRKRLVDLDHECVSLSRSALAQQLAAAPVPAGVAQGPVGSLTERALIEHEIGKQRRHVPLRDLLHRAAAATRALKPCFMMSPASVAQFLAPVGEPFDLAIIDEASQMRPEEALGIAGRARQLIVVGDPMQLPPPSFLDGPGEDGEAEMRDDEPDVDAASILDMALSTMRPARDLRWHYRSRHHSLIAYPNREFYGNGLVVFPAPQDAGAERRVEWLPVPQGIYAGGINAAEADVVVARVARLMREHPSASIGVVAINQPQRDLLIERFDALFARDPELEAYRARWAASLEDFFVKYLEHVQGDERDVIVISVVYGPATPGGPVAQRFGPINSRTGHRRLNVLFTRAKERVVLVSSLMPEHITPTAASGRGVHALRGYLEYARSGRLDPGAAAGRVAGGPFEREVAQLLVQHGYDVEPQVGVAGCFVDLAVRHPTRREEFVLGIECDGATCHSVRGVRDRDRVRPDILERLGWTLYRVWSSDWYNGREREQRRLLEHLEHLVIA